ncbi:lycopene beta and epsilon cyclase [Candidatus Magnetoovum chiemensis]|nr:lycopene beta and epsilon cyclase [Candidatus Magnetoovum chiemensis]
MVGSNVYEIIILGGGISGLLLASELSKRHCVAVFEKEPQIPQNKYWLTDKGSLDKNPHLKHLIDTTYEHMDFIAYDGTSYRCSGSYNLWDTKKLTEYLVNEILGNSGHVKTLCQFYGYTLKNNGIEVLANDKTYRCKLAVDCMGYASPLIYSKGVIDLRGYYLVYGKTVKSKKQLDPVGFHNVTLNDKKPLYLEAFQRKNGDIHAVLIVPVRDLNDNYNLKEEFDFIAEKSSYSQYFDGEIGELSGVVPVGTVRRKALDRVLFYGEAGQINPAATGTALTWLLYTYKDLARVLSSKVKSNRLNLHNLDSLNVKYFSSYNRRLQMNFYRQLLKWNSFDYRNFVAELKNLDNSDIANNIIFATFNRKNLLSKQMLGYLRRIKSPIIIGSMVKSFFW